MQKLYKIVVASLMIAIVYPYNNLQAQKCCIECQADVKSIINKQVLLEKIDIKEGTSLTNVSANVYVSYRSGNVQKFWANLAIATAGVLVSSQLSNENFTEGKNQNAVSPIIPLSVSIATLPSIWKNRPRGVPQAGIYIQHRDTQGNLLETWEQPISNEAKNSAELLTVIIDKPLSAGALEIYVQNGSKNDVFYWGLQTLKEIINKEKHFTKTTLPKPNKPVINELTCGEGTHDNGWGECEIDVVVIVTAPPYNPNPWETTGPGPGNPGNSGGDSGGDSGGPAEGGEPDEDRPETMNKGFHFDMLRGDGSIIGDYITPVVTSYESGTLFRPNSRSQWKFQSFSFSSIGISGRLLFEVWIASSLNAIPNIDSDGSHASMNHTWQLVRNAALGEIIIPGAITYTTHQNNYGYNAN